MSTGTNSNDDNSNGETTNNNNLLLLFLGLNDKHQIPHSHNPWDYLTIYEIVNLRLISKSIYMALDRIEYKQCRDGNDYLVSYPAYPGILSTPNDKLINAGLFAHQLSSLELMYQYENGRRGVGVGGISRGEGEDDGEGEDEAGSNSVSGSGSGSSISQQPVFGTLRGGILGDAPGLGKTITMLAFITSTAGMRPISPPEFWEDSKSNSNSNNDTNDDEKSNNISTSASTSIDEGWKALRLNEHSSTDILSALRPIRKWVQTNITNKKTNPNYVTYKTLEKYITPPYKHDKLQSISELLSHCNKTLRSFIPRYEMELFRRNIINLKCGLDKRNRKLLSRSTSGTASGTGGGSSSCDQEKWKRIMYERKLLPSSATLIIVPDALLEHWYTQILNHLNLTLFADENENNHNIHHDMEVEVNNNNNDDDDGHNIGRTSTRTRKYTPARGVVYLDGIGDLADARIPLGKVQSLERQQVKPSWELSKFMITITTFSRCQSEFKKEVMAGRMDRITAQTNNGGHNNNNNNNNNSSGSRRGRRGRKRTYDAVEGIMGDQSPLLDVRWLRVVVDEGHELGCHEASNGVVQFINKIAADRRWVLSGTPMTGDEDDHEFTSNSLDQLQRLLYFLRHPVYGNIPSSLSLHSADEEEEGEERGEAIVSPYVYNHKQYDDTNMKKDQRKNQAKEKWTTIVKDPFLKRNEKGRYELLSVLREVMVMHKKEDIDLPKPIFIQAEVNLPIPIGIDEMIVQEQSKKKTMLDNFLKSEDFQSLVDKKQAEYITQSIRNGQKDRLSADNSIDERPVKAIVYSSDNNNLLSVLEQLYQCLDSENIAEMCGSSISDMSTELSRFRNGCKEIIKCPICDGTNKVTNQRCDRILIEVMERNNPQNRFMIEPERIIQPCTPDLGGNVEVGRCHPFALQKYNQLAQFWRVGDILEVDVRDPHPLLIKRRNNEIWESYGSIECQRLSERDGHSGIDGYFGPLPSRNNLNAEEEENGNSNNEQDLDHTLIVTLTRWGQCGKFHNSKWYTGPQFYNTPKEIIQEDVFLMCLDASLSHGLDLSFVTHIFLLEAIEDAAHLEQVTSRAHRLGATGPVRVITVNVFYEISKTLETLIKGEEKAEQEKKRSKKSIKHGHLRLSSESISFSSQKEKEVSLKKVICDFCYRTFDSHDEAMKHEQFHCQRNPMNKSVIDPYHLSSVYQEIKPPKPSRSSNSICNSCCISNSICI